MRRARVFAVMKSGIFRHFDTFLGRPILSELAPLSSLSQLPWEMRQLGQLNFKDGDILNL